MATKEEARKLLQQHAAERKHPLTPEEIKRRMGWPLIQAAEKAKQQK